MGDNLELDSVEGVYRLGLIVMTRRIILLSFLLLAAPRSFPQSAPKLTVRSVKILGNVRIPTDTILHYISTAPNQIFDERKTREELRTLHDLGLFQTLDIQAQEIGDGLVDVIFRVHELPFISEFVMEGLSQAQQDQLQKLLVQEKLEVKTFTPCRPGEVNKTANFIRTWLRTHKYPLAEVRVITEEEREGTARVRLAVTTGPKLDIGEVNFVGNPSISSGDLRRQLQYTRPSPAILSFLNRGIYTTQSLAADLENVQRYYQSRGFAAARLGTPEVVVRSFPRRWWMFLPIMRGTKQKLAVNIPVTEGPKFTLVGIASEGNAKAAAAPVAELIATIQTPRPYDYTLLDSKRQKMVDALGHAGYGLARVELEQSIRDDVRTVSVVYRILAGDPIAVGKIHFEGNIRLKEKFLRRDVVAREGEMFDSAKLDESIKKINRSGIVKEIQRRDVSLAMNGTTHLLDITFKVKEKDRQGIYGTGGTGGVGGGYLGILYTAFDLLGLGEALTLQIDGGASQSNMLLNIVGQRFLGLPFNLGLSIFSRLINYNVASLVPDAPDLIHVLRHRSTGMGLSGAYPITSTLQVGLAAQFQHLTISEESSGSILQESVQNRLDLSPTFFYDSTHGTGPAMRGTRFAFVHSWSGTDMLRNLDSTAQSVRFSQYVRDPISGGRNSFAFGLQAARIRPRNGAPLTQDRRFFPGDEIVRGFRRGGLTPWAYPSDTQTSPTPLGADSVLGVSAEYRVPIQGPLSAAAFIDLGLGRLSRKNLDSSMAASLIDQTNGILRGSLGGELRLQLPMIHQPGRVIFSWNFLRLSTLIWSKGGMFRLADPRGTIHFALGDRF
jgi:outer membrane protein assembly complex protein YaeT